MTTQVEPSSLAYARVSDHSGATQREVVLVEGQEAVRALDLVTPSGESDTTVPSGREFGTPFAALTRREKIRIALANARRAGKPVGRKRVVVPIEQAQKLLGEGKSLREASRVLGISVGSLHRAVHQGRAAHQVVQVAQAIQEAA